MGMRTLTLMSLLACAAWAGSVAGVDAASHAKHPVAQVTSKRLRVESHEVAIGLSNPSGQAIHGLVRLSKATPPKPGVSRLVSHSARYQLAAHGHQTVRVGLTSVGREALRTRKTIAVNVAVRPRVGTTHKSRLQLSR
jgi:hypothetical protein